LQRTHLFRRPIIGCIWLARSALRMMDCIAGTDFRGGT
jgi:hypothetical protein